VLKDRERRLGKCEVCETVFLNLDYSFVVYTGKNILVVRENIQVTWLLVEWRWRQYFALLVAALIC